MRTSIKETLVAAWANAYDALLLRGLDRRVCRVVVLEGSAIAELVRANFLPHEIVTVTPERHFAFPSFHDLLFHTNIVECLKAAGINHLVVPYRNDVRATSWAQEHDIVLIAPPWELQAHLENKIEFDHMLKRAGISSPPTHTTDNTLVPGSTYVVQTPSGMGLSGTRFYQHKPTTTPFLQPGTLVREYVSGTPVGVSIFISESEGIWCSALRRQCFEYEQGYPQVFLGIQWLRSDTLSQGTSLLLQGVLEQLAHLIHTSGYRGVANVDLVIAQDNVFVLECNPRPSAASVQLYGIPEVTHQEHPWYTFVHATDDASHSHANEIFDIPPSTFEGSYLEIDVPAKTELIKILPLGMYTIEGSSLILQSTDLRTLQSSGDQVCILHELTQPDDLIDEEFTIASIMSNVALFDSTTGTLNERGKLVYTYVRACTLL